MSARYPIPEHDLGYPWPHFLLLSPVCGQPCLGPKHHPELLDYGGSRAGTLFSRLFLLSQRFAGLLYLSQEAQLGGTPDLTSDLDEGHPPSVCPTPASIYCSSPPVRTSGILHLFWTPGMKDFVRNLLVLVVTFQCPVENPSHCVKFWWRNLLNINNFWPESEMCAAWSWYLANDFQFFCISPVFLILMGTISPLAWVKYSQYFIKELHMTREGAPGVHRHRQLDQHRLYD